MALFGLEWIPSKKKIVHASEAQGSELLMLKRLICENGHFALNERYAHSCKLYTTEYAKYEELCANTSQWKEHIDKLMSHCSDPLIREQITQAAQAWKAMDPNFHLVYNSLDRESQNRVYDYYQYLDVVEAQQAKEELLWRLNASLEVMLTAASQFESEAQVISQQESKMLGEEKKAKEKQSRALAHYKKLAQIARQQHKQTANANSAASTIQKPRFSQDVSLLESLAPISLPAQPPSRKVPHSAGSSRSQHGKPFYSWLAPSRSKQPPKDFF